MAPGGPIVPAGDCCIGLACVNAQIQPSSRERIDGVSCQAAQTHSHEDSHDHILCDCEADEKQEHAEQDESCGSVQQPAVVSVTNCDGNNVPAKPLIKHVIV